MILNLYFCGSSLVVVFSCRSVFFPFPTVNGMSTTGCAIVGIGVCWCVAWWLTSVYGRVVDCDFKQNF